MLKSIKIGWIALNELGWREVALYGLYRLGLLTGFFRRLTPLQSNLAEFPLELTPLFSLPDKVAFLNLLGEHLSDLKVEADEIVDGDYRIFGGKPVKLDLAPKGAARHWVEVKPQPGQDIKLTWEPARFGWAFTLGRAYLATTDERYAQSFWQYWQTFMLANPVNCGPNWESGQEVALRLIAWIFAAQVFLVSPHSTPQRMQGLLNAIGHHAERIPATLIYARAQNNNHLISEACGLYLAGVSLPAHPKAAHWKRLGWKWLTHALTVQIASDGTYTQHSMNYHRMVLHLALLGQAAARTSGEAFPSLVNRRLEAATRWLLAQIDLKSGDVPNLGNNDGANILPLAGCAFRDHRSAAQAASAGFLGKPAFPGGPWDELAAWLGIKIPSVLGLPAVVDSEGIKLLGTGDEWATLRAVTLNSRPAHADQLHVDLWFGGRNILLDPGTYSYNLAAPWDNSLVGSQFHNCLTIDGQQPMMRAGRFLWLKRDQARWVMKGGQSTRMLTAEHDGYKRFGISHQRSLQWIQPGRWEVTDRLFGKSGKHSAEVNWITCDGQAQLEKNTFSIITEGIKLSIEVVVEPTKIPVRIQHRIVRAGKLIYGEPPAAENEGWYSPTYLNRIPAIAYRAIIGFETALTIKTLINIKKI